MSMCQLWRHHRFLSDDVHAFFLVSPPLVFICMSGQHWFGGFIFFDVWLPKQKGVFNSTLLIYRMKMCLHMQMKCLAYCHQSIFLPLWIPWGAASFQCLGLCPRLEHSSVLSASACRYQGGQLQGEETWRWPEDGFRSVTSPWQQSAAWPYFGLARPSVMSLKSRDTLHHFLHPGLMLTFLRFVIIQRKYLKIEICLCVCVCCPRKRISFNTYNLFSPPW